MRTDLIVRVHLTFIQLAPVIIFISVWIFFVEIPKFSHPIQTESAIHPVVQYLKAESLFLVNLMGPVILHLTFVRNFLQELLML